MNQKITTFQEQNIKLSFYEKNMNDLIEEHLKKYQSQETKRAYKNDIQ